MEKGTWIYARLQGEMAKDVAKRLTEFVREQTGNGLRTIVILTDDGWEGVYLRDDLRKEYDYGSFDTAVEAFRNTQLDTPGAAPLPLGDRRAAVFYHENAFVLQFPYSERETILVSITPEAGQNLLEFIENCHQIVLAESER